MYIVVLTLTLLACKNNRTAEPDPAISANQSSEKVDTAIVDAENAVKINPVEHATIVLNWDETTIYVDPVGGAKMFSQYKTPSLILITDIHGDHLDISTLEAIAVKNTRIIAPQAVFDKLPVSLQNKTEVLKNNEKSTTYAIEIKAIPMYNLRPEALKFHEKGRGNGYVLEKNGKRLYISGDTEDISEMRNLKNIDIAFVCMNLPYTMTVENAAEAVLSFQPKTVYPYHYRGTEGFSDVEKFKTLVTKENSEILVNQLDWYPNN